MRPIRFALIRLHAHIDRTLVVALGIAIGAAMLALTAVGAVAVQDRASVGRCRARVHFFVPATLAPW